METHIPKLLQEEKQVKRELERLTAALPRSDDPPESVVKSISEREQRVRSIRSQLDPPAPAPP